MVEISDRLKQLPPYLFVRLDEMKNEVKARGVDVIDLGIGDPDRPTPGHIVAAGVKAMEDPAHHRYPSSAGLASFREAAANWMARRFGVEVGPEAVGCLIGSKEGIGHLPLAFINPGDIALVPSPAYPVYKIGTMFAGGESHIMPLKQENGFLPDLPAIPKDVADAARLMFLNYPNNPTAATCGLEFMEEAVAFCKKHDIILCHDNAYSELAYDGYEPPSILQVKGAMDCAIELHSLSKSYNMTGWRVGFSVGCEKAVAALTRVKSNIDSGNFEAVQAAGIEAMDRGADDIKELRKMYQKRRDTLMRGLDALGIEYEKPKGTFYIWARAPGGMSSEEWVAFLLDKAGIMTSPGSGYGPEGEGYFRMALIVPEERMGEAVERMKKLSGSGELKGG